MQRLGAQVRAGSIVSLHLGHAGTVAAMPGILRLLERRGCGPVTASELVQDAVSARTSRRPGLALAVAGVLLAAGCSSTAAPQPTPDPSARVEPPPTSALRRPRL